MRLTTTLAIAALSLSAFACSSTEHKIIVHDAPDGSDTSATDPASADAGVGPFCQSMCARVAACDKTLDVQTCQNQCDNANAAVFPRLRQDVVDLVVACFDGKDCKTVLAGDLVATCATESTARVAPSDAAATFCDALASAESKCGRTAQKAACLDSAKLYGDDAIAQADNCTKRACSELDACVGAVFSGVGAGIGAPPKTDPGTCQSGSFSGLGACGTCAENACCAQATACFADPECRSAAEACATYGTSSPSCYQPLQSAPSSTQQLAGALLSCLQSSCSGSCSSP